VDTLRADHLGLYGYERPTSPNIDRFFGDGAIFERAYSTDANTSPSVISILTGQLPQDHRVRLFYQHVPEATELLPSLLPEVYQTAAFVSNVVLTREALGIAGRFDHYDDFVGEESGVHNVYERRASRTTNAALAWLASERDLGRPLFLWIHYIDPHGPYGPPKEWTRKFSSQYPEPATATPPQPLIPHSSTADGPAWVARYDDEIAYTDAAIERFLDGYARLAPIDRALVILTADHGEAMMEHAIWFTHGYSVYDEAVRVPLLMKGPGVDRGRRAGLVSGIDIVPTVLEAVGVQIPAHLGGFDLRRRDAVPSTRVVFTEATWLKAQWRAAIQATGKWMLRVTPDAPEPTAHIYYDLEKDPRELAGGEWVQPNDASAALLDLVRSDPDPGGIPTEYRKGMRPSAPKVAPGVSDHAMEKLRALGYVE
jgi:arylsulfatase